MGRYERKNMWIGGDDEDDFDDDGDDFDDFDDYDDGGDGDDGDDGDNSDEADYDGNEKTTMSNLLARTLTSSPKLGTLVRRLVLLTSAHDYQSTKNHIHILRQCPFVEDLKIWGYNGHLLKSYQRVVAGLTCVRTLNINRRCLHDLPTDLFTDDAEYLEMLKGYPKLEQVMVSSCIYDYWSRKALTSYCERRGIHFSDDVDDY